MGGLVSMLTGNRGTFTCCCWCHMPTIILFKAKTTKTYNKKEKPPSNSHLGYLSTRTIPKGGMHIDLFTQLLSTKERLWPTWQGLLSLQLLPWHRGHRRKHIQTISPCCALLTSLPPAYITLIAANIIVWNDCSFMRALQGFLYLLYKRPAPSDPYEFCQKASNTWSSFCVWFSS